MTLFNIKIIKLKKIVIAVLILGIFCLLINPAKTYYRNVKLKNEYHGLINSCPADILEEKKELEKIYKENDIDSIKNITSSHKIFVTKLEKDLKDLKISLKPKLLGLKEYSLEDITHKNENIFYNSLKTYVGKEKINKIPHIHHRIWVTSNECPTEVSADLLKKYIDGLKVFPKDWKHIFWCQDARKIPKTIKALKESPIKIDIRNIDDLIKEMPGKLLFNRLLEEKYFAAVVDILKRYVVYKLGGLYCDIGMQWLSDPTDFIDKFDRIVCATKYNGASIDITYLANTANQKAEKMLFDVFENFPNLPTDIKKQYAGSNILKVTWENLVHYLLITQMGKTDKVMMLRRDSNYFEWKGMNSWKKGTSGNSSITKSTVQW